MTTNFITRENVNLNCKRNDNVIINRENKIIAIMGKHCKSVVHTKHFWESISRNYHIFLNVRKSSPCILSYGQKVRKLSFVLQFWKNILKERCLLYPGMCDESLKHLSIDVIRLCLNPPCHCCRAHWKNALSIDLLFVFESVEHSLCCNGHCFLE